MIFEELFRAPNHFYLYTNEINIEELKVYKYFSLRENCQNQRQGNSSRQQPIYDTKFHVRLLRQNSGASIVVLNS